SRSRTVLSRLGLERCGYGLCHLQELLPNPLVGYRIIQADELNGLRPLQLLTPLPVLGADIAVVRLQIAKKVGDRYTEDVGHRRKPRGAHPIGAAFVLLHLLESESERIG